MDVHSRREFVKKVSCTAMTVVAGARSSAAADPGNVLDAFIEAEMKAQKIPGLAACIVKSGRIVWSKGYGWSDIKKQLAMDPNRTVQNIGSISKTVTATAAMQLWEKGKFELDDDINHYLPFPVRNPLHADKLISFRSLLTHRSSIADGPAYGVATRAAIRTPPWKLGSKITSLRMGTIIRKKRISIPGSQGKSITIRMSVSACSAIWWNGCRANPFTDSRRRTSSIPWG